MGTASAKPGKLHAFVEAAGVIRGELAGRIAELRASYDAFQASGSSFVGNPDLMDVELPGLVARYETNEDFVAVTRQAFLDADSGTVVNGRVVVDAGAFATAFAAAAVRMGFDPAALLAVTDPVTVDTPVAAGTPRTSGFVADPVCTATGHFLEVEDDFTWPDRLDVLRWRRVYSSRFVAAGPFGRGWASWASVALVAQDDGSVGYQGPDGQMAVFGSAVSPDDGSAGYGRVSGIAARLVRVPAAVSGNGSSDGGSNGTSNGHGSRPSGWELVWDRHSERPGAVWAFDADGRLTTVTDPAMGTVTFAYTGGLVTSVAHEGGRRLELEWDGPRVTVVRSSCGRVARYQYDGAGDLVRTERVLGDRRYETDDNGRIVEVWDADGVRLCRNTYDPVGRVLAQVSPFGREVRFAYHPGGRTVVSDSDGGPVNIYEHDPTGRLVGLVDDRGHHMQRSFDPEGRCVAATGFDGATSRQAFAPDGRAATRTGPGGVEEHWDYDDSGRVTRHAVEGGPTLVFDYADDGPVPSRLSGPDGWEVRVEVADGVVSELTDADGVTVRFDHDGDGNVVATTNALGATVRTEPHVSGLAARVVHPDGAAVELDRDPAGRLLGWRTATGDEFTVEWSPAGRLTGMVTPDEGHTSFEHGTHGAIERIVDAVGATLELTHDHLERLVGLAAPGGAKWEFGYSGVGLLSLVHDPAGGAWSYDHDAEGRLVAATNPLGDTVRQRFDPAGLAEVIDPAGNATRHTRDALGRIVRTDAPEGATTVYDWDVWGRPTALRFPDGDTLTYAYTPAGRVRSVTTAEGRGWTSDYDRAGRLASVTDATGATTRFVWDVCDRLVETTSPEGRVERRVYDAAGRPVETTIAGRSRRATYDHAGRVTSLTDPLGATSRYRYDLRGKLVAANDPLGHQVRIRYDERGNPTAVLDPFGGITTTEYDGMRRPVATTDQLGRATVIRRDAAGRVVRRELPTGDVVEWVRDPRGLATDVGVNGRDTVVFDRDRAGRPVVIHEPARNRTFTLEWTRGGRLASLDVDGARMRWDRDRDRLVTGRHDAAGRSTRYAHDAAGRRTTMSSERWGTVELDRDLDGRLVALRAEGVTRRWDRDTGGLVAAYTESGPAGDRTTTLVRDDSGRVVEARSGGTVTVYGYDAAGQLVSAVTPAGPWTWAYDEAGRLVAETGPDGDTRYDYDEAHQLVRMVGPAGTTGFSYDAAGRRTGEDGPTGTRRYDWDGLGRLTGIVDRDRRARQVDIDALGQLAVFDGTQLAWDSTRAVPELVAIDDREVVAAAGHTLATASPTGIDWLSADWQGTVIPAGGPGRGADRDPWGARTDDGDPQAASSARAFGFLGELELGGLTWLRHRLYDPTTRQFVAPDPLPGIPGTPVATTPYHYGNNDPVGHVDPLGLQPLTIDAYNEYREQETSVNWGNIAMGALMVGSFFIPGGPIVATLVGAGLGMAPGIINGITTGNWDAGSIIKGAVVGGIAGRLGFGMGGASPTLGQALLRGGLSGGATGSVGEAYDMLPLPGSDGQFDLENVALETVVGTATGGMGHRLNNPAELTAIDHQTTSPVDLHAFGNRTAPRDPRPDPDMEIVDGQFVAQAPPLPRGASTFGDPQQAPLSGQYHRLPAGTELPDGFAVVADGSDVVPNSPHPPTHHTIYPTRDMPPDEFQQGFRDLPWEHAGKKK
jgi:RHS repeat-associated protein